MSKLYKFLLICLILLLLSVYVSSIVIIVNANHEACFHKDLKSPDTLKISYIVSGQDEHATSSKLHGPYSTMLYQNLNENKGHFESEIHNDGILNFKNKGTYTLCFETTAAVSEVSFEYFSLHEGGHIVNIAKEGVFDNINKNITLISERFEEIDTNLKYYAERREAHHKSKNL